MALIIAEKPSVAKKIATFLSKGNYKAFGKTNKFYYFKLNNEPFYVVSAVGHLYNLVDNSFHYPTFNYKWEVEKGKESVVKTIEKFKNERKVIVATDYDIEGELIGYNILRFALNRNNAERMVFSAITPKDIWEAFINRRKSIDFNYAIAGETRHIVDWLYGINLSRALTHAIRKYIPGVVLSIGRVQGPTLKLVFEKEKEIENFKSKYYYKVLAETYKNGEKIVFDHVKEKFENEEEAKKVLENTDGKLKVIKVEKKIEILKPPYPYNLSDIQQDAYSLYRISPKETLMILQKLYTSGYISYPRTNSQKLPENLNYRYILSQLKKIPNYFKFASYLLTKPVLKPNNGPKEDAHPAIYPTGFIPINLSKKEQLIYDLIARRFLATLMEPAKIENIKVYAKSGKETFVYSYKRYLGKV